jgi:hypothetical protein
MNATTELHDRRSEQRDRRDRLDRRKPCNHETLTSPPVDPTISGIVTFVATILLVGGLVAYVVSVAVFAAGKMVHP